MRDERLAFCDESGIGRKKVDLQQATHTPPTQQRDDFQRVGLDILALY
jgi:hypothetical protein